MGAGIVTANEIELWYEDFGEVTDPHVVAPLTGDCRPHPRGSSSR